MLEETEIVLPLDSATGTRTQAAHPLTQALEQYSSSEPAVHSGLFLNALISCAPWGGLLAVVGVAEAGAAAAVEQKKYTYRVWNMFYFCLFEIQFGD